jgi:polyhydroxyalkanoate synthesis regulator protein
METLTKEQDRFRKQFANAFTPQGAFEAYQEQARKNLAMFEQAMTMFTPFTPGKPGAKKEDAPAAKEPAPSPKSEPAAGSDLEDMKSQLAAMQAKIEKLSRDRS